MMFYWNADPIFLQLGPIAIHWYGVLFAAGFLIGYYLMQRMYRKENRPTNQLDELLTYIFIGTVVGARLAHTLIYEPDYYLAHPIEILEVWQGGLASHGGGLGVLLAIWYFIRKHPENTYLWVADRLVIPTALTGCFIRLGNFMNSEILGNPTDGTWGVVFQRVDSIPRHPAQLYESICYLFTFLILLACYHKGKGKQSGFLFGLFMILIFVARFAVEFFKTPQADYEAGFEISVGQWLSVPFILLGIIMLVRSYKIRQKQGTITSQEDSK